MNAIALLRIALLTMSLVIVTYSSALSENPSPCAQTLDPIVIHARNLAASNRFAEASGVLSEAARAMQQCLRGQSHTLINEEKQLAELWQLSGEYAIRSGNLNIARARLLNAQAVLYSLRNRHALPSDEFDDIAADYHAVDFDLAEANARMRPCQQRADDLSAKASLQEKASQFKAAFDTSAQAAKILDSCLAGSAQQNTYSLLRLGQLWATVGRLAIVLKYKSIAKTSLLRARDLFYLLSRNASLGGAIQGEVLAELHVVNAQLKVL